MRGDYCHNEILTGRLRQVAEACGATVHVEFTVWIKGVAHYIDLFVEKGGRRFVVEPEQTPHRVPNDVGKAIAVGAELLLIPTPDAPTAHACRRRLHRHPPTDTKLKVIICPLGAALEILRQTLSAGSGPAAPGVPNFRNEF